MVTCHWTARSIDLTPGRPFLGPLDRLSSPQVQLRVGSGVAGGMGGGRGVSFFALWCVRADGFVCNDWATQAPIWQLNRSNGLGLNAFFTLIHSHTLNHSGSCRGVVCSRRLLLGCVARLSEPGELERRVFSLRRCPSCGGVECHGQGGVWGPHMRPNNGCKRPRLLFAPVVPCSGRLLPAGEGGGQSATALEGRNGILRAAHPLVPCCGGRGAWRRMPHTPACFIAF